MPLSSDKVEVLLLPNLASVNEVAKAMGYSDVADLVDQSKGRFNNSDEIVGHYTFSEDATEPVKPLKRQKELIKILGIEYGTSAAESTPNVIVYKDAKGKLFVDEEVYLA